MKKNRSAARVKKPSPRLSVSGFLLLAMLMMPLAAHAQGGSPFDSGFTAMQTLFTGTVAKVTSLIAIVLGGYADASTRQDHQAMERCRFAQCERQSLRLLG